MELYNLSWSHTTCPLFLGERAHFIQPNDVEIVHTAVCTAFFLLGTGILTCHLEMDTRVGFSFWAVFHFWLLRIKLLGALVYKTRVDMYFLFSF